MRAHEQEKAKDSPDLVYVRPVAGAENWEDGLAVKRIDLSLI